MTTLRYQTFPEDPAGPFTKLLVAAHGYGANAENLLPLGPDMAPPGTLFVSVNAPTLCPHSADGFQWMPLDEDKIDHCLQNLKTYPLAGEILSPGELFQATVRDLQQRYNITATHTYLLGFSQGAMIALEVGLTAAPPLCAGIIAYSGMLCRNPGPASQNSPKVLLVHGDADTVVPLEASEHAFQTLKGLGYDVTLMKCPHLEHSISWDGIQAGLALITQKC